MRLRVFDEIPQDILYLIAKHLSHKPFSETWMLHVDSDDVATILDSDSALRPVCLNLFRALTSGWTDSISREDALRSSKEETFLQLASKNRQDIHTLVLKFRKHDWTPRADDLLLFSGMTNLRVLAIASYYPYSDTESRIISACGSSLTELRLYGVQTLKAKTTQSIGDHCRSLESLTILHSQVEFDADIFTMFAQIGSTLRHLRFNPPKKEFNRGFSYNEMSTLAKSCSSLEHIEIRYSRGIEFMKTLESPLRHVRFVSTKKREWYPTYAQLSRIFERFPSLTVHGHLNRDRFAEWRITGSRLHNLYLDISGIPIFTLPNDLPPTVTNLRSLTMSVMYATESPAIPMIFAHLGPNLHSLHLWTIDFKKDLNLLDTAAKTLTNLTSLRFSTKDPVGDNEMESILNANPKLSDLYIEYRELDTESWSCELDEFKWVKKIVLQTPMLITSLKRHVSLRLFEVNPIMSFRGTGLDRYLEISDACANLRSRNICIEVGQEQYLPVDHTYNKQTQFPHGRSVDEFEPSHCQYMGCRERTSSYEQE